MMKDEIDIRHVARTLSLIENRRAESLDILRRAYANARYIPVVGITGPPGAGKSSLLDQIAFYYAEKGERVAVLAIDPSSPYTGGAVLGDRFRMNRASAHPHVFVRSLSSRGQVGGLSGALQDLVTVIAALNFDRVIVETVGSGQSDIEVARFADCIIVVSVPGLGDQIQAAKAGILEIGDLYVVNKCDLPGADTVAGHLAANLSLVYPGKPGVNEPGPMRINLALHANAAVRQRHGNAASDGSFWRPPVLRTSANDGAGVEALCVAVDAFLEWLRLTGRDAQRRTERFQSHILQLASGRLLAQLPPDDGSPRALPTLAQAVMQGGMTPDHASELLLDSLFHAWQQRCDPIS